MSCSVEKPRITLRFIRATGMRSTSAWGRVSLVTFFARTKTNSSGMNLCCEADLKGKSHGCDLQSNSLQQERNQRLITRENNDKIIRITARAKKYTLVQTLFTASATNTR
jgi:hypothetical protein